MQYGYITLTLSFKADILSTTFAGARVSMQVTVNILYPHEYTLVRLYLF